MVVVKSVAILSCAAVLALGACTNTRHIGVGSDPAELEAERQRTAAEEARADALAEALADLGAALDARTASDNTTAIREEVANARTRLEEVETGLTAQPDGPAKTAAEVALGAVGDALTAVNAALGVDATVTVAGGFGAAPASTHTDLHRAQAAVDDARAKLKTALAANPTSQIRTLLLQAQSMLGVAQTSLLSPLYAELETYDPRVTLGERLTPLQDQRATLPASLAPTGTATFTPRTTSTLATLSATANPDALDIQDEAVVYADGDRLFPASGSGGISTDEFPMRGIATRGDQLGRLPDRSTDNTINPAVMGSGAGVATWSNYDATYESSIRMNADGDGITLEMGGAGTIFYDMEWLTALGPGATQNQPAGGTCANVDDARCDDPTTSDIAASFGTPVADPDGDAAWHFTLRVPVNPATPHTETRSYDDLPNWAKFVDDDGQTLYRVADASGPYEDGTGRYRVERAVHGSGDVGAGWQPLEYRRALRIDRGRPVDQQGVYNVKLSNYAGGAGTDAAPHRYLQYAAYGLFNFLDYSTREVHHGRFQAFHFGYDAFSDATGQRPADWGTAANPVTATFEGRTTGWLLQSQHGGSISDVVRLRGDVTLTANLNAGGDGHGTVSGFMRNFEFLNNDVWGTDTRYKLLQQAPASAGTVYPVAGDPRPGKAVILEVSDIAADGSFGGVAYAAHNSAHDPDGPSGPMGPGASRHNFTDGTYGGAFYGPRELGRLEAAGYWRLPAARHGPPDGTAVTSAGTILGSFGATSKASASD